MTLIVQIVIMAVVSAVSAEAAFRAYDWWKRRR